MKFNPYAKPRSSIRLPDYDYSQNGAYFVTICVKGKKKLFGKIGGDEVHLNEFGKIALEEWSKTATLRLGIELDEFIVMPNHVHGIIIIDPSRRALRAMPLLRDLAN